MIRYLFVLLFILAGCSSADIDREYIPIRDGHKGFSDTFKSESERFEVIGESLETSKNAAGIALLRARELCGGNFIVEELESGIIITSDCGKCPTASYYKAEITCKP